jgi:hypothetical protein
MSMMRRPIGLLVSALLIASLSFTSGASSGRAAETAAASNNVELGAQLLNAKIVDSSYKLTCTVSDEQILITTQKKARATDAELKIQSVLLSKIAFDTIKSGPQRVKIMFFDFDANGYSEVSVKRAEVMLFGEGKLSQKDLLSSLEVKSTKALEDTSGANGVVAGPLQPERQMAMERIERLQKRGTNVTAFQKLFDQIEQAAKDDQKEEVSKQLADLNRRLKDQEEVLKALAERKRVGVAGTAGSAGSASHSGSHAGENNGANQLPGGTAALSEQAGNQLGNLWQTWADGNTGSYPPDMKETAARVRKNVVFLGVHGRNTQTGIMRLSQVRDLVERGQIDPARALLNSTAAQIEEIVRSVEQQQNFPRQ